MKLAPLMILGLAVACAPDADSSAQNTATAKRSAAPAATRANAPALPVGAPRLSLPVACKIGETCALQNHVDRDPGPEAKDYRCGRQTYQAHGGVDIRLLDLAAQRAGVEVLAAAPGTVSRLRDGVVDVSVKAEGAGSVAGSECGNGVVIAHGGAWETQYCHLARGSIKVKQGDTVEAGQPIAQVGLSGNTEYPHLHLTVRHGAETIDPFAPAEGRKDCHPQGASGSGLWDTAAANALSYRRGVVLNAGFAAAPVSMDAVEAGGISQPSASSENLLAYVRAINLEGGDVQRLVIKRPDGSVLVQSQLAALDRAKAQYVMYAGKPTPAGGWPAGAYVATYTVERGGAIAVERRFSIRL